MRKLFVTFLMLAACNDDLPPPGVIANLRIAAVQTEPPEAHVGDSVALSALIMTPDNSVIDRLWVACVVKPGTLESDCVQAAMAGQPVSCGDDPEAQVCILGSDPEETYVVPQLARFGRKADEDGEVVITLVAASTAVGLVPCLASTGQPDAPEDCRIAIKRIVVRPDGAAATNKNPVITSLTASSDGETLTVALAPDAFETLPDGTQERLFFTWFSVGGELENFRTDATLEDGFANAFKPEEAALASHAAVIVRDGRGGESWATIDLPGTPQ